MSEFSTVKEQIVSEYGVVVGWIKNHVAYCLIGCGVLLWVLGRLHLPF